MTRIPILSTFLVSVALLFGTTFASEHSVLSVQKQSPQRFTRNRRGIRSSHATGRRRRKAMEELAEVETVQSTFAHALLQRRKSNLEHKLVVGKTDSEEEIDTANFWKFGMSMPSEGKPGDSTGTSPPPKDGDDDDDDDDDDGDNNGGSGGNGGNGGDGVAPTEAPVNVPTSSPTPPPPTTAPIATTTAPIAPTTAPTESATTTVSSDYTIVIETPTAAPVEDSTPAPTMLPPVPSNSGSQAPLVTLTPVARPTEAPEAYDIDRTLAPTQLGLNTAPPTSGAQRMGGTILLVIGLPLVAMMGLWFV